ncbi:BrnA antitoxin family protein [Roseovarius salinarum]|uniref:BrnA antitoxin family protein n=1 Tax=Roseovarius salinarum TaxID=1981892 RepID=UPI000C3353A1|nr:BrnA antitoxin family protein [Roseovarius salinarum]
MAAMSKSQRIARERLMHDLIYLMREDWIPRTVAEEIPDAWHTLEHDLDVAEPKVKVTLYLDASVAKFYRAMGRGYQARINRLLGTYARMKIAHEVRMDEMLAKRMAEREE